MDRKQDDSYREVLGGGGIKPKGDRTHGCGQQCGNAGGWEGRIRGINGHGKNTIKRILF